MLRLYSLARAIVTAIDRSEQPPGLVASPCTKRVGILLGTSVNGRVAQSEVSGRLILAR